MAGLEEPSPKDLKSAGAEALLLVVKYPGNPDVEGLQDAVCTGNRTKRYQDPITWPPCSLVLATCSSQTKELALLVLHLTLCACL